MSLNGRKLPVLGFGNLTAIDCEFNPMLPFRIYLWELNYDFVRISYFTRSSFLRLPGSSGISVTSMNGVNVRAISR